MQLRLERWCAMFLAGVLFGGLPLRADAPEVKLVMTTDDGDVDSGDDFVICPCDGETSTIYIWGKAGPDDDYIAEFNFDLDVSGSSLTFSDATIGQYFMDHPNSLWETNLNDLQFGWSRFYGLNILLPEDEYTLFGTVDVTMDATCARGTTTILSIDGEDRTMKDHELNQIITRGVERDLTPDCTGMGVECPEQLSYCVDNYACQRTPRFGTCGECDYSGGCTGERICVCGVCELESQ